MMVLVIEHQPAENTHFFAKIKIPESMQRFQLFKFISYIVLTSAELKFRFFPQQQKRTSWVVTCRGKNRYVVELHLNGPDRNPTSSELQLERSVAKERDDMEQSSIEETHAKQFQIQTNPVYNVSEEVIPVEERKWNDILAYKHFSCSKTL